MRRSTLVFLAIISVAPSPATAAVLTHGPIVFAPDTVSVWGRTGTAAAVRIDYGPVGGLLTSSSATVLTGAASDFTFAVPLEALSPSELYTYVVNIDGQDRATGTVKAPPDDADQGDVRVAIISDSFKSYDAPALSAIAASNPDGLIVGGDHSHDNWGTNCSGAECLAKSRAIERALRDTTTRFGRSMQSLISSGIPWLGRIRDDHDAGNDNVSDKFKWWAEGLQSLVEYHAFAANNGLQEEYMYQAFRRGLARFILLDLRSHRHTTNPGKTILGSVQKVWLVNELDACANDPGVRWCILISTVPFNPKVSKPDAWHAFQSDATWLLARINERPGLLAKILVWSGDCHWGSIVLPPHSPLPEINGPKINPDKGTFANTCDNQPSQWSPGLNSTTAGSGWSELALGMTQATMKIRNANGSVRFSVTIPAP